MPNSVHPRVTNDGPRNSVIDVTGVLDDGDLELQTLVDKDGLYAEPGYKVTKLRIDTIDRSVDPGIIVELLWEDKDGYHAHATSFHGVGTMNAERMGGKHNDAMKPTGNILIRTRGYTKGRNTFSFSIELVKQFT